MKERPILFSGAMVRAILDGRKTQTRRVCKGVVFDTEFAKECGAFLATKKGAWICDTESTAMLEHCPYGQPGDRLWLRETWAHETDFGTETGGFMYRASYTNGGPADNVKKWRPSIFMPRQASRITLELTGVRVERVQDISGSDAAQEGVNGLTIDGKEYVPQCANDNRLGFMQLWDGINAERGYGWSANPWVWAITFRRVNQ